MNRTLAHLLTRLYPRPWRKRYGEEFEAFLQSGRGGFGASMNVVWSAFRERIFPTLGVKMDQNPRSFRAMVMRPSAFLPMAMSLAALAVVLVHIVRFGIAREADEGATAHIWQLLMATQMPVVAFFAIKWMPRAPKQAVYILALQAGVALASMAPVFFLGL